MVPRLPPDVARRTELADFLRKRREALQPEDVGLPGGGRRRTPGLRREEVATLAGVGATWYTWLEQARDVRASEQVLAAVAGALQLGDDERDHLLLLGRGESGVSRAPDEHVPAPLRRLIDNLGTSPICIVGRRSDFLAWNVAYAALFGDPTGLPDGRRNQIWALFNDPFRRALFPDWEAAARTSVARFRGDCASHVGDPQFAELIADLQRDADFRRFWKRHEVLGHGTGRKWFDHPLVGEMAFEHTVVRLEDEPDQRMTLYTPLPDYDTAAKMARLVEHRASPA